MMDWLVGTAVVAFALLPATKALAVAVKIGADVAVTAVVVYLLRTPVRHTLIVVSGVVALAVSLGLGAFAAAAASGAPEVWAQAKSDVGAFAVVVWAPTALFAMLARLQDARRGSPADASPEDVRRTRRELGYDD